MTIKNTAQSSWRAGATNNAPREADPSASFSVVLQNIMHTHSFRFFLAAGFPQADKLGFRSNIIASNWPQELIDRYDAADLLTSYLRDLG